MAHKGTITAISSFLALGAFVHLGLAGGYAWASSLSDEEIERQASVLTRVQPAFDSEGIQFANFVLKPLITTTAEFDDNVFSSATRREFDRVLILKPEAELSSTFNRHFLSFKTFAEHGKYQNFKDENYTDAGASFSGRADIAGDFAIPLSLKYEHSHLKRGVPDEDNVLEPTRVKNSSAATGLRYDGDNLSGSLNAILEKYSFEDNATQNGFVDNSDRNREEVLLTAFIGLSKEHIFSPFGYVGYQDINYRRDIDDNGFRRSSRSFASGLGLNIELSGVLHSRLQAGYNTREFDDTRFDDINGLIYNANLVWEPSTLLALNATAQRSIVESTLSNFSASVDDTYSLGATYELMPNVLVKPNIAYLNRTYEGIGARDLDRFTGNVELTYKLNRNMWANFAYEYIKQQESIGNSTNAEFGKNKYTTSLKLKL